MSMHTAHIEAPLTLEQAVLTDHICNEVVRIPLCRTESIPPHHRMRNGSPFGVDVAQSFARAPPRRQSLHPHRRDGPRPGHPVQRPQLQSARGRGANVPDGLGELPLHDHRDTIAKKYPLNYYFLSQALASELMTADNQNHFVSQVMGGQIEQSDVDVKNVTITSHIS